MNTFVCNLGALHLRLHVVALPLFFRLTPLFFQLNALNAAIFPVQRR